MSTNPHKPGTPEWRKEMQERLEAATKKAVAKGTPQQWRPGEMFGKVVATRRRKSPEGDVQRVCLEWLKHQTGAWSFRLNNLPTPLKGGGFRPVSVPGLPDAVTIYKGRFIGWEFKSIAGRQSPAQVFVQGCIEKAGGKYFLIHSLEELQQAWRSVA